ncbi:MAG: flagellar hook-basal body complex protein [Alphaproteobacteria bacterium]
MTASVSGLNAQGEAMSVISDNLSNANTVGYKSTRALFSQLVTTAGSGGSYNAGGSISVIQRAQKTQGSIVSSNSVTDMAISGDGFFIVTDQSTVNTDTAFYYTRAGSFAENKEGYLTNPDGLFLQGWRTDSEGSVLDIANPASVELQSVGVSAQASAEVSIGANLTSTEVNNDNYNTGAALSSTIAAFVGDPTLADYVTDVRLYDAQGAARDVSVSFSKRAENFWDWAIYTDGSNIEGGTTNVDTLLSSTSFGTLRFNNDGTLKYITGADIAVDWDGAVTDGDLTMDFGDYTGGNVVTSNTNLGFTDGVLDINVEDEVAVLGTTAPTGTYTLAQTAAGTLRITDPNGQTATATFSSGSDQELLFQFSGTRTYDVRITLTDDFAPVWGGSTATLGTYAVTSPAGLGDADGTNGVVQFAATYNTDFVNQDGFGSGVLSNIQVDGDGFISGTFTNGETKKLWKLSMAIFQNPAGLDPVTGTLLQTTDLSGQPLLKEANTGGTGTVVSGALEGSTTDIANEFSQMIISQRTYQANSTVISTVDQMLNDLLQLR